MTKRFKRVVEWNKWVFTPFLLIGVPLIIIGVGSMLWEHSFTEGGLTLLVIGIVSTLIEVLGNTIVNREVHWEEIK